MRSMTAERSRRVIIKLHADQHACASIDRAARIHRISRAEFILEAACREAEALVVDSRFFVLDDHSFSRFVDALDRRPSLANRRLRRLLSVRTPWRR